MKKSKLLDIFILLVLTYQLTRPLFHREYFDVWGSIESTFIADARMLRDHLPHPGWQPMWYCGTRFDYIYPPALRYGSALISKFGNVSAARAYHIYTGIFYALGILAMYWLVLAGSRSRGAAMVAACAAALLSPSFLLLKQYRLDSPDWVPQRLHALVIYGEGPHSSAASVLLAALAASFIALRTNSRRLFAVAALACALTVSNNFYGATALAILFPIVVWSVWLEKLNPRIWLRAAALAGFAYGLCAAWLTPSYLKITGVDLKWVSEPGNTRSRLVALLVIALFGFASYRLGKRRPDRSWTIFVAGSALLIGLMVLGYFYFGIRVIGDQSRFILELDIVLILTGVEILRRLWNRGRVWRIGAIVLAAASFLPAIHYVQHARSAFPRTGPLEDQYQYRITKWVNDHLPGERVFANGSIRFWYDAWFDNVEQDGGSLQGMLNQNLPVAAWQIGMGDAPELSRLWLQALGTDAIVVTDKTAPDPFQDFDKPEKFRGAFPVLFDDQHGTVIYRVPRKAPGIGRVVDRSRIADVGVIQIGSETRTLSRYVAAIEDSSRKPAPATWRGFDSLDIDAAVSRGESVLIQETYDPAWRAYSAGRPLTMHRDQTMGFMLIDAPEGVHHIEMRFETPLENRIGQAITIACLLLVIVLFAKPNAPARW